MGIPILTKNGELPPGEHKTTLAEIEKRFGKSNHKRVALMKGLWAASQNFIEAGVKNIWVNGSFVTSKAEPNDIDGCWEYTNAVDLEKLDSVFLMRNRVPMKEKYGLEFFISNLVEGASGQPFSNFFQLNRNQDPKGILVVHLGDK